MTGLVTAANDTFRSFRVRNFRLFFSGQLVSVTGTWMQTIAVIWVVLDLTDSGVALGLVMAAQFLPALLFGAWGGVVADRLDRHRVIVMTQALSALVGAAFAVLAFTDRLGVVAVYGLTGLLGIVKALDTPSRRTLVADLVEPSDVPNAVALNSAMTTGSQITGPAIAGILISTGGVEWCFLVNTVSFLAVIGALLAMDRSLVRESPMVKRASGQLREGFRYVWHAPELRVPMVVLAVVGMFTLEFRVTLPLFAERSLLGTSTTFTLLYSSMSVGSVLGALTIARRRDVDTSFLGRAALALGACMGALAIAPNVVVALVLVVPVGASAVMLVSGTKSAVQLRAATEMRGRALSFIDVVYTGGLPIGGLIIGAVSEGYGARAGIMLGAIAAAGTGTWVLSERVRLVRGRGGVEAAEAVAGGATDRCWRHE